MGLQPIEGQIRREHFVIPTPRHDPTGGRPKGWGVGSEKEIPVSNEYPQTVAEVLDPNAKYKPAVLAAVRRFAKTKPWRGSEDERKAKFLTVHSDLCRIYQRTTRLEFGVLDGGCSGSSHYTPSTDTITLCGALSVVTALHEFAHVLGRDERGACRWSISLFARCFRHSFARCRHDGHTLRRPDSL